MNPRIHIVVLLALVVCLGYELHQQDWPRVVLCLALVGLLEVAAS